MMTIKWPVQEEKKKDSVITRYPADARVEPSRDINKLVKEILSGDKPKRKQIWKF
ncbi:hypothetical protein PUW24_00860 (plasmid) [Paenibacillus urinalis]|uniref:Uncharacterized protein n=1 Tax=Paenibacillus urinalis TaxID=521520 RepID=A0AAX3N6Y8_9BACL|nr:MULTISPECIES: hypothetical protein [Paenibacillus]MCM3130536.1 hypothetical protein [Paenibacillus sp. MER 78]WDH85422.1 hypothetical protein PUW23_25635 [Paenibacillus urinalis]WDH95140.1 hypothetical protein PUW24_00860 [Paenibacillus urinalis]WDI05388.1 hypothetical protein PUW25_26715 [Paenibacillus urinalis]